MRVLIHNFWKKSSFALIVALATGLVSCATQRHVALVDDPDARGESQIPWNKKEKWEDAGPMGNLSDRR